MDYNKKKKPFLTFSIFYFYLYVNKTFLQLTWGDFVFAGIYAYLKSMMQTPDLDSQYPSFKKLEEKVYSLPKVKAWADTAPKCDF